MLTNSREKKICEVYSARDEHDRVHCWECPLQKEISRDGIFDARRTAIMTGTQESGNMILIIE